MLGARERVKVAEASREHRSGAGIEPQSGRRWSSHGIFFFLSLFFFPCAGCTRFPNIGVLPASNHLPNHPLHPLSQALSPCALPPLAARAAGVVALSQKGHSVIIYRQMAQHQVPDPGLLGSSRSCSHLATHTQVAGWLVLQGVPLREGNASRQLFPSSVVFETL